MIYEIFENRIETNVVYLEYRIDMNATCIYLHSNSNLFDDNYVHKNVHRYAKDIRVYYYMI